MDSVGVDSWSAATPYRSRERPDADPSAERRGEPHARGREQDDACNEGARRKRDEKNQGPRCHDGSKDSDPAHARPTSGRPVRRPAPVHR